MHHPTNRITHTTAFVTPVVEHWPTGFMADDLVQREKGWPNEEHYYVRIISHFIINSVVGGALANKRRLINSDNRAVVSILNTNTSRLPEVMILVGWC